MNNLILATYLAIGTPQGEILPDQDAPRYAIKAIYKQAELDKAVSRIEKQYLPKPWKKYGGYVILGTTLATQKRISYTWRF
jgi:hypothetical protein